MNYCTYSTESWLLISSKQQWIYSYHLIPWYILQSRPSRSTVGCLTPILSWCHSNPSLLLQLWNLAFQSWFKCFAATYPKVNWILIPSICCCICRATNVEGALHSMFSNLLRRCWSWAILHLLPIFNPWYRCCHLNYKRNQFWQKMSQTVRESNVCGLVETQLETNSLWVTCIS